MFLRPRKSKPCEVISYLPSSDTMVENTDVNTEHVTLM